MADTKTQTTVAADLRRAAKTLRDRAKRATPGPWTSEHASWAGDNAVLSYATNGHAVAVCGEEIKGADHPASADAAWIALMNPDVADSLAAWLEVEAGHVEELGVHPTLGFGCSTRAALAVARALNGSTS